MDLITRLCNPVIVMSQGEHLAEGSPEEIKQDERVLEAYLGGQYR
jgi:branched-chain amino acid transport system ATP-binding protein